MCFSGSVLYNRPAVPSRLGSLNRCKGLIFHLKYCAGQRNFPIFLILINLPDGQRDQLRVPNRQRSRSGQPVISEICDLRDYNIGKTVFLCCKRGRIPQRQSASHEGRKAGVFFFRIAVFKIFRKIIIGISRYAFRQLPRPCSDTGDHRTAVFSRRLALQNRISGGQGKCRSLHRRLVHIRLLQLQGQLCRIVHAQIQVFTAHIKIQCCRIADIRSSIQRFSRINIFVIRITVQLNDPVPANVQPIREGKTARAVCRKRCVSFIGKAVIIIISPLLPPRIITLQLHPDAGKGHSSGMTFKIGIQLPGGHV